ncbi:hypothetical protein [Niallia sp. NCCP-28]|uniref:hypothetical protein n=1 Tax=Niallia sp. NCCP-28 TaxID=2934712 RepID=UPI002086707A|nr:hypothetical protein [Niallia sp. NCCP-28]GKU82910.1 hypothetical protein NCCP28_23060 [Niallia sp. NCCP-28]
MKNISTLLSIISILSIFFGSLVTYDTYMSKSNVAYQFLTDEQKRKSNIYSVFMFSLLIGIIFGFFWLAFNHFILRHKIDSELLGFSVSAGCTVFIFSLISSGKIAKIIFNFRKYHIKYKFQLPNENDYLYIYGMMNETTCICCKVPDANLDKDNIQTYLVKVDDLGKTPITKEKVLNPQSNILIKIFL